LLNCGEWANNFQNVNDEMIAQKTNNSEFFLILRPCPVLLHLAFIICSVVLACIEGSWPHMVWQFAMRPPDNGLRRNFLIHGIRSGWKSAGHVAIDLSCLIQTLKMRPEEPPAA
jgi:hypothetical protein